VEGWASFFRALMLTYELWAYSPRKMTQKYELSEKRVKEVYGDKFEDKLALLKEGFDYIKVKDKRCLAGVKRVYRADLLDSLEKKVGLAQDKVKLDVSPVKLNIQDEVIFTEEVENIFPNTRYVRVKSGKTIYVGAKGNMIKRGQKISYKGTTMFLGKAQS
jgi:hypothetical protein